MMRRSFAEVDSAQSQSRRMKELSTLQEELVSFSGLNDCSKCVPSIHEYYQKCSQIMALTRNIQVNFVLQVLT